MTIQQLVQTRHSVRSYNPERTISRSVLERVLEAGRLAPSATNNQPWRFLVIQSEEMLEKVRGAYPQRWFNDAPCVLIAAGDQKDAWVRSYDGYNSLETDLTIAMDHMILAATEEGLGTCWIAAFKPDVLRKALNLGPTEQVFAITPLGYPPDDYRPKGSKRRKSLGEIAEYL